MSDETDDSPLDDLYVDEDGADDDLDALVQDADEARQRYQESQQRLSDVKNRLHGIVDDLKRETDTDAEDADRLGKIQKMIDRGEYADARDEIRAFVDDHSLRFDDAEKQRFARHFADNWHELVSRVEVVQTAFVELVERGGWSESDLVDWLNAKHRINKTTTRDVLDAAEKLEHMDPENPRDVARVLAAMDHDLTIEATTDALKAIKEEADSR